MAETNFKIFHSILETGYKMLLVKNDEHIILYSSPVQNMFFKTIGIVLLLNPNHPGVITSFLITKDGTEIKGAEVVCKDIESEIEVKRALYQTLLPYEETEIRLFPKESDFASSFGEYLSIVGMEAVFYDYYCFYNFERAFTEVYELSDSIELRTLTYCVMITSLAWTGDPEYKKFLSKTRSVLKTRIEADYDDYTMLDSDEFSESIGSKLKFYMHEIKSCVRNENYLPGYTYHSFFVAPLSFDEEFDESFYDAADYKQFAVVFRSSIQNFIKTLCGDFDLELGKTRELLALSPL